VCVCACVGVGRHLLTLAKAPPIQSTCISLYLKRNKQGGTTGVISILRDGFTTFQLLLISRCAASTHTHAHLATFVCTHIHTGTRTCTCTHAYAHARVPMHINTQAHTHARAHMHTHTLAYTYTKAYTPGHGARQFPHLPA